MTAGVMIINKFYQMYFYNNVQDDINNVVADALKKSSAKEWDQATPILYVAMGNVMGGNLKVNKGFFSKLFQ
jgi:hypothetical protein